ncbi:MAG: FIST N-terminal domain-containing protein [Candidatus Omnitrophota bacterium]
MSTFIGLGVSEKNDPFQAGCEAAKMAAYQLHHKEVTFGILFSSIHLADKKLLEGVQYTIGNIKLIGCTGAAVIHANKISKYGVCLMLVSSAKIKCGCAASSSIQSRSARLAAEEFAHKALKDLGTSHRDLALIFSDGLVEHGSDLLHGIKDVLGLSFPVFGGSSADNLRFYKTFQYYNNELFSNNVVGAIFAGQNSFGIGVRHGWKPLGKPHLITEVKGNVIKKIGNKPAVCIYEDYFGKTRADIEKNLIRMSIYYPLGLYVPGETEYLLRNALRIDAEGGLICQGDASEGNEVRLMMGTKEWAIEAAIQAAQEAKSSLTGKTIKGAIIFESISRNKLLGRLTERELCRIKEILGEVPIIGICTYGEQAPLKSLTHYGETYFHNETVAILAIGESDAQH